MSPLRLLPVQPLVKFKSHLYYEDKDNIPESTKSLRPLSGSKILFFKNGECQGVAFEDVYAGSYYPTLSLHKNATVSVNFGPHFKFSPACDYEYRGVSERSSIVSLSLLLMILDERKSAGSHLRTVRRRYALSDGK